MVHPASGSPQSRDRISGTDARSLALEALALARGRRTFVRDVLDSLISRKGLKSRDAALATELAMGVIRHRLTLDRVLSRFLSAPLGQLRPGLPDVLRLGAYQLIWLDRVPNFAAVNEGVAQASRLGGERAGSLVNAVLRQVVRHQGEAPVDIAQAQPDRAVCIDARRARLFNLPIFPDPGRQPIAYLSAATSHPAEVVERWVRQFGRDRAEQICWYGASRPPLILRPNRLRVGLPELCDRLRDEGAAVASDAARDVVFVLRGPPLRELTAFRAGLCQPQDPTAMAVVHLANPQPGETIIDLCAAPGTKATYAAERMLNRGVVIASDLDREKLSGLAENCRRLGIRVVETVLADDLESVAAPCKRIDLVLVDAPCSNSGVLARRPEARYRINRRALLRLSAVQLGLLDRAAGLARAETRIVYSTCSIEPEENERVVQAFCVRHDDWHVTQSRLVVPCAARDVCSWRDGGFMAVLVREH